MNDTARPPQAAEPAARAKGRRRAPNRPAPGSRKIHPVLERLATLYPKLFGARFLPLKVGVYEELLARHGEEFPAEELKAEMALHARSTRYLECVAAGLQRHDLDGAPVTPVAPEHVHYAILEVFRRRQARKPDEDLRPRTIARLVAAIEASGLSREDYMLRVPSRDAAANALLDEAFAELGRQAARHEALRRAFEASGQTPEAFAAMYGVAPGEVRRALAQPAPTAGA